MMKSKKNQSLHIPMKSGVRRTMNTEATRTVNGGTETDTHAVEENSQFEGKIFSVFTRSQKLHKTTHIVTANLKSSLKAGRAKSRNQKKKIVNSNNRMIYDYFTRESKTRSDLNLLRLGKSDQIDLTDHPDSNDSVTTITLT